MTKTANRVVRLWWRCTICRTRFDIFGISHDQDRACAADHALPHLHGHGIEPKTYKEAGALLEPDGSTSRVVRHALIVNPADLDPT